MESLAISQTDNKPTMDSREFADLLVNMVAEKKGERIELYGLTEQSSYTDYIVICSGTSDRHVITIAEFVKEQAKKHGQMPLGTEGFQKGHWALIDYGDVIVHVFYEPVREYYALERMWGKETRIELPPEINA
jgi:ribosome-associated protein